MWQLTYHGKRYGIRYESFDEVFKAFMRLRHCFFGLYWQAVPQEGIEPPAAC
jgi:hypothetical protein